MLDLAGLPEAVNGEPEAAEVPKAGGSLVSLGAGSGSKSATMYQIKYASKESAEVSASGSVLFDAQAHNKEFASVAEDAEVLTKKMPEACPAGLGLGQLLSSSRELCRCLGLRLRWEPQHRECHPKKSQRQP